MSTVYVELPRELTLDDGLVHVRHWRTKDFVVYQNYSTTIEHGGEFLGRANQIAGQNLFHVYQIIQIQPAGEELGPKVASFSDVNAAMTYIEKAEQLA